jgi:photosystem II stability/assembly factor-like uncharacterized protein
VTGGGAVTIFKRKRLVVAGAVLVFVAVFAAIGAVSRSSPATATAVTTTAGAGGVPSATWYWTMAVSATDANVLVLGTNTGLYRSADGGKTWQPTGPKGIEATSLVQTGGTIYAGGVPLAVNGSPVIRTSTGRSAPNGTAVLTASTDDGKTWTQIHPGGLPNVAIQALAVDPSSAGALYAVLNNGKLYRSTDSAKSFQLLATKTEKTPWALASAGSGHFVAGDMDTGNYVSSNNGKTWQPTPFVNTQASKMVMEYAAQPTNPTRILMTAFGIELSTDGGKTWHTTLKTQVMFGPVAWAASPSSTAYAIGFDGTLWHTTDNGATWKQVTATG